MTRTSGEVSWSSSEEGTPQHRLAGLLRAPSPRSPWLVRAQGQSSTTRWRESGRGGEGEVERERRRKGEGRGRREVTGGKMRE